VALGLGLVVLAGAAVLMAPAGSRVPAWWPGAGLSVAAAATATGGRRRMIVLVVLAATVIGNLAAGRSVTIAVALGAGTALEALLVGWWLGRDGAPRLRSMIDLGELLVAASCGAALAGGVAALGVLLVGGSGPMSFLPAVSASHLAAVLVVVPLVMRLPGRPTPVGWPEQITLWTAVPASAGIVFGLGAALPLSFVVVAVLAWSASRIGARAAAVQLVVVGVAAAALTRAGTGPFAQVGRFYPPPAVGTLVQLLVVASALVVLVLAVSAAQRAAAIDELADQRRFDQAVLEVVNAGVVACDAEGAIVVRNAANRRLAGDRQAQAADLRYEDGTLVPPGQSPLRQALAGEDVTGLLLRVGPRPFEIIAVARQIRGEDGRLMGAVAALTDVTAEREVQDRLRESVAFRDAVFAASPDLIYTKDPDRGVLNWVSRDAAEVFGHRPKDVAGERITEAYMHPDDLPRIAESDAAAGRLDDGEVLALRFRVIDQHGRYHWYARRVTPFRRDADGEGRAIAPDVFIPLAEDNGLIAPLGRRVLETACGDLAGWHARHPSRRGLGVSVNLSARQADLTDLTAEVRDALACTGLAATLLTVELTETVLVEAGHATLAALHTLREMGVRIAIDDFGTGYAGLRHLAQLPITGLKIDKSFTMGLPDDPTSVTIVRTIASLARDLDLSCVAEGIETDAQLLALPSGLVGQGWLLGRPVSCAEIDALLGDRSFGRPLA
jgi:PAS domain S-box-containing protein